MKNNESPKLTVIKGGLAAFGDPVLDAMYENSKGSRPNPDHQPVKQLCPSCGKSAYLSKQYVATLCDECHKGIDDAVARNGKW